MGDLFNQPVDEFIVPQRLETLVLSEWFDQPLDKLLLPHTLRHLSCQGWKYHPMSQLLAWPPLWFLCLKCCLTRC